MEPTIQGARLAENVFGCGQDGAVLGGAEGSEHQLTGPGMNFWRDLPTSETLWTSRIWVAIPRFLSAAKVPR